MGIIYQYTICNSCLNPLNSLQYITRGSRFSNLEIRICIKEKAIFYLLSRAVPVREYEWCCLGVLHCGRWVLAVRCCGWWVVRGVRCWLWLTWNHFFGDCSPREVEEPHECLLFMCESWDGRNNYHKFTLFSDNPKDEVLLYQLRNFSCLII